MVEDRIRNIEARVQSSASLPDATKAELLDLIAALRAELPAVNKEHLDRAESATGPRGGENIESMEDALGGITGTMTELEATHPRLAALANRLAVALSSMGI
jgi:hypothetical protein